MNDTESTMRPLPPDPENMNDDRAEWAAAALRHFQCITGTDYEDSLGDLLCDLMHWADRNNFDFEAALFRARGHYEAETMPVQACSEDTPRHSHRHVSPIEAAQALTPRWMMNIRDFDALEIHPCIVVGQDGLGADIVEQCEPEGAHFWCVFGHFRTGGVDDFENFATEAEAQAFHDRLIAAYPHLAGERD